MIAEFDHIMQEHLRSIQNEEIHSHNLGHNIQNGLIDILALEIRNTIIKRIKESTYFSCIPVCTYPMYKSSRTNVSYIKMCRYINKSDKNRKVLH